MPGQTPPVANLVSQIIAAVASLPRGVAGNVTESGNTASGVQPATTFAADENLAVLGDVRYYRSNSPGKAVSSLFSLVMKVADGKVTYPQFPKDGSQLLQGRLLDRPHRTRCRAVPGLTLGIADGIPAQAATAPQQGTSLESSSDEYAGLVTEGARRDAGEQPVRWLTAAEVDSWLSVIRLTTWLPWSIDQQLRRDSNLGMVEYQVLARLSNRPGRTLRMSSLADLVNASLSRLSHLVTRLEARGLVHREPDPEDGRFTNAILTDKGYQTLAEAAPGHVAHVRSLVIDVLSPEQLRRLGRDADRIVSRIDTSPAN